MNDIVIKQPRLYTPLQIGLGSFFGGPVAMVYFLWQNFKTLDNQNGMQYCLAGGILFNVGLLLFMPMLPDHFPGVVIPFLYSLVALSVAATWQMRRDAIEHSVHYLFQSNWRVLLISVILLLVWLGGAYLLAVWLDALGIIDLGEAPSAPELDDLSI
ncbi:MAG: hypothetical protein EP323_06825 [Gammaproteobacteria bacterium]|nr:MAG: hypothetical protein EP323_06825 [Gammaproteobacteria bacterium]